jgi:hypothetical protein
MSCRPPARRVGPFRPEDGLTTGEQDSWPYTRPTREAVRQTTCEGVRGHYSSPRPSPKASSRLPRSSTSSVGQPARSEAGSGCGPRWWPWSAPPGSCRSRTSWSGGGSLDPSPTEPSHAAEGLSAQRRLDGGCTTPHPPRLLVAHRRMHHQPPRLPLDNRRRGPAALARRCHPHRSIRPSSLWAVSLRRSGDGPGGTQLEVFPAVRPPRRSQPGSRSSGRTRSQAPAVCGA